jgi:hypothetical protein
LTWLNIPIPRRALMGYAVSHCDTVKLVSDVINGFGGEKPPSLMGVVVSSHRSEEMALPRRGEKNSP